MSRTRVRSRGFRFSEKGGQMGQVEVREGPAAEGRGVFATKALPKGTVRATRGTER